MTFTPLDAVRRRSLSFSHPVERLVILPTSHSDTHLPRSDWQESLNPQRPVLSRTASSEADTASFQQTSLSNSQLLVPPQPHKRYRSLSATSMTALKRYWPRSGKTSVNTSASHSTVSVNDPTRLAVPESLPSVDRKGKGKLRLSRSMDTISGVVQRFAESAEYLGGNLGDEIRYRAGNLKDDVEYLKAIAELKKMDWDLKLSLLGSKRGLLNDITANTKDRLRDLPASAEYHVGNLWDSTRYHAGNMADSIGYFLDDATHDLYRSASRRVKSAASSVTGRSRPVSGTVTPSSPQQSGFIIDGVETPHHASSSRTPINSQGPTRYSDSLFEETFNPSSSQATSSFPAPAYQEGPSLRKTQSGTSILVDEITGTELRQNEETGTFGNPSTNPQITVSEHPETISPQLTRNSFGNVLPSRKISNEGPSATSSTPVVERADSIPSIATSSRQNTMSTDSRSNSFPLSTAPTSRTATFQIEPEVDSTEGTDRRSSIESIESFIAKKPATEERFAQLVDRLFKRHEKLEATRPEGHPDLKKSTKMLEEIPAEYNERIGTE